jgi:L-ribulose-5-phosphate 4-epimerase
VKDEGVIKFQCRLNETGPLETERLGQLIQCRQLLFQEGLIGAYPDGIGYGNLSMRLPGSRGFIISASQTGHLPVLDVRHFVEVTGYSIDENWIDCRGPARASSESLTHAMIYEAFPYAQAVIHVHNAQSWEQLRGRIPTTRDSVAYGTPEMAHEVRRLSVESNLNQTRVFVMGGHQDGIFAFAGKLAEAHNLLIQAISEP